MRIKILWEPTALSGLERPAGKAIEQVLGLPVDVEENGILIAGFDPRRHQYDAQKILNRIQLHKRKHRIRAPLLLVTSRDLFVRGLDFVFGLARESTGVAVVSTVRLHNEFYGKRTDDDLLLSRVTTESGHELGHLLGLPHCADSSCIMFPPETLDQLDGKKPALCPLCRAALDRLLALDPSTSPSET